MKVKAIILSTLCASFSFCKQTPADRCFLASGCKDNPPEYMQRLSSARPFSLTFPGKCTRPNGLRFPILMGLKLGVFHCDYSSKKDICPIAGLLSNSILVQSLCGQGLCAVADGPSYVSYVAALNIALIRMDPPDLGYAFVKSISGTQLGIVSGRVFADDGGTGKIIFQDYASAPLIADWKIESADISEKENRCP